MAAGYGVGRSSQRRERFAHDVFLSFRGEDVRKRFIDHLRHALDQKGITAFYDDKGLERGDEIQSKLYEAIESSEIAIVTFSRRYADSRWCLDELVKIMERRGSHSLIVLPVFYKVDPTDVRHQTGTYAEAFPKHDTKYGCERVNKWKQAMTSAADLRGFHPQSNEYEAQFIQRIVKEVDRKLDARQLDIPKYMVGAESSLIRKISMWLQNGSSQVEVGIIFGPGGVGKTTTAKVVYNENYRAFEYSSFLAGVRTAHENDIEFIRLQKQLICNITRDETVSIDNVSQGKQKIKRAIGTKKILVVLDDVEEKVELDELFNYPEWFVSGSKILLTTRSRDLLINEKSISRFEACLLDDESSIELFSRHAFEQAYPLQNYEKISMLFIKYCDGLPLALEVLASTLRSITFEKWELEFHRLREYPLKKVHNILKWSFDSIEQSTVKDIFLHIAFYMVGMKKEYALKILDGCGLHGEIGLQNLIDKCLVSDCDILGMHQLIQNMGYEVVRQESPIKLGCRSRLLGSNDAYEVLRKKTGTSAIKGFHLKNPDPLDDDIAPEEPYASHLTKRMHTSYIHSNPSRKVPLHVKPVKTDVFTKMSDLDLLLIENVQIDGCFEDFPKGIKWLLWRGCPLSEIPLDFDLEELVVLDMQKSNLVHGWNDSKFMGALKILNLSHSHHLVSTPDLSNAPMLEWISCKDCISLMKVHESIGELENLTELILEGCINLVTLPECIGASKKLTRFTMEGYRNLRNLPINMLYSLESLNLGGCSNLFVAFNQAETSITTGLESRSNIILSATSHNNTPPRPPIFNIFLPSLKQLFLANCGISRDDIMEVISCAPSLKHLDLRNNPIRVLGNMNRGRPCLKLNSLVVDTCPNLQSISNILYQCSLGVKNCDSLRRITFYKKISVIKEQQRQHLIETKDYEKLVDMKHGVSVDTVIERMSKMNEDRARYLGFPNLDTFGYPHMDIGGFGRGIYKAGMYNVFLRGEHMAEWFLPTTTYEGVPIVSYWVPSFHPHNERPIRALNLGLVGTMDRYSLAIKNVTRMWRWFYCQPWWTDSLLGKIKDEKLTWLSHWCVTEHRQIKPGDLLQIHIPYDCEYIGVKVIYEVGQLDGEGAEKDDEEVRGTCKSVDSSRIRNSNQKGKEEGIDDSDTDVAVWYNNIFRSVDLSLYFVGKAGEVKQKTNEEISCDASSAYIKVYDTGSPFLL